MVTPRTTRLHIDLSIYAPDTEYYLGWRQGTLESLEPQYTSGFHFLQWGELEESQDPRNFTFRTPTCKFTVRGSVRIASDVFAMHDACSHIAQRVSPTRAQSAPVFGS